MLHGCNGERSEELLVADDADLGHAQPLGVAMIIATCL
jgi:hypothetical protein